MLFVSCWLWSVAIWSWICSVIRFWMSLLSLCVLINLLLVLISLCVLLYDFHNKINRPTYHQLIKNLRMLFLALVLGLRPGLDAMSLSMPWNSIVLTNVLKNRSNAGCFIYFILLLVVSRPTTTNRRCGLCSWSFTHLMTMCKSLVVALNPCWHPNTNYDGHTWYNVRSADLLPFGREGSNKWIGLEFNRVSCPYCTLNEWSFISLAGVAILCPEGRRVNVATEASYLMSACLCDADFGRCNFVVWGARQQVLNSQELLLVVGRRRRLWLVCRDVLFV